MKLTFVGIPDKDLPAFSEGVRETLIKLKVTAGGEEFSPPDENGECVFIIEYEIGETEDYGKEQVT